MVVCYYDINSIISETLKNRQLATLQNTFLKIHKILKSRGRNPKVYIINHECSRDLK